MKFEGKEEALKILQNLSTKERKTILKNIALKNPSLASELEQSLMSIDDLIYLTPHQTAEFIRDIDLFELGMSLRLAKAETRDHVLKLLTSNLAKDVQEGIDSKLTTTEKIQECIDRVLMVVKLKVDSGKLTLDADSSSKMV